MNVPQSSKIDQPRAPDSSIALAVLAELFGAASPINLVAIPPDGKPTGHTSPRVDSPDAKAWLDSHQGKANLYFMVNAPRADAPHGKLKESDVAHIRAVYADVDPREEAERLPGGFDRERERLDAQARQVAESECPPTAIIDSGNGLQYFWLLAEPLPNTAEHAQRAKALGVRIADKLGGDHVQNLDRVMRVPRTANLPNRKKRERGRAASVSALWRGLGEQEALLHLKKRYTFDELESFFGRLPIAQDGEPTPSAPAAGPNPSVSGPALEWEKIWSGPDAALLRRLESACDSDTKLRNRWNGSPDGLADASRSGFDQSIIALLMRHGLTKSECAALWATWPHGSGEDRIARNFERAWERTHAREELDGLSVEDALQQIKSDPPTIQSATHAKMLAELAKRNPEQLERIKADLTQGPNAPVGVRAFGQALKRGEALKRQDFQAQRAEEDPRAVVRCRPSGTPEAAAEVERAILQDGDFAHAQVFRFGDHLCSVVQAQPKTVRQLAGGDIYPLTPIVARYSRASLRERIEQSARFLKQSGSREDWKPSDCPDEVIDALLVKSNSAFPPLTGIIEAPTLRPDGSIISAPGYDKATGLWAAFDPQKFPTVPERPTEAEARSALKWIATELFRDFPFASSSDRAVALTSLVTAVLRRSVPGDMPGYVFSAPTQASGKTALARSICCAAFGRPPAVSPWPKSEEEMGKSLTAMLGEGRPEILFDNMPEGGGFDSAVLALALTNGTFKNRVLGHSRSTEVPTSVLFLATGNNVRPVGDLASRFLTCYLDPQMERPDKRAFARSDLESWVAQNRGRIVTGVLTAVRAHIAAGRPNGFGETRFKAWDEWVRAPLLWAGCPDPAEKIDEAYAADESRSDLDELLTAWAAFLGHGKHSASEVVSRVRRGRELSDGEAENLGTAIERACGVNALTEPRALGVQLKRHLAKVSNGLRLVSQRDGHSKSAVWCVERLNAANDATAIRPTG